MREQLVTDQSISKYSVFTPYDYLMISVAFFGSLSRWLSWEIDVAYVLPLCYLVGTWCGTYKKVRVPNLRIQDGHMAPGVCGNGSVPLSLSGTSLENWNTHTHTHTFPKCASIFSNYGKHLSCASSTVSIGM